MKGLIIKDLLSLKAYAGVLAAIVVFYFAVGFASDNVSFAIGIIQIYTTILVLNTFSYDSYVKWDKYGLSLPVTRKNMVASKYVLSIILLIIGVLFSSLFVTVTFLLKRNNVASEYLLESFFTIGGTVFAAVAFIAILLPIVYRYGVEKSRICMMLIFAIPMGILLVLKKIGISSPPIEVIKGILYACPILIILGFIASYFISLHIYLKKEF